jgi:nucleotidyltransferase/DNA polymerase involved in DNA repair
MIACVVIPYFAAAVQRQTDPMLLDLPMLLVEYGAKRSKIAAVSREAAEMNAAPGLSLSRARGLCPAGHFLPFHEHDLQTAADGLLKTFWQFTNRVELDEAAYPQTGVFYLDLGNLRAEDACLLGEQIQEAVSQQMQTAASIGLASGKFPAYAAAVGQTGKTTLVPRHEEGRFVASYSVSLLPLSKRTARTLDILCIRQIGQFAALPREAVLSQFGKEGRLLYSLAHGLDGRPVKPRQMPKTELVSRQFEHPLTDRTRLDIAIHHMAEDLCQRLEKRSMALHAITLTLHLDGGKSRVENLHLLQSVASAAGIARTIQQLLERVKLTKGVTGLEVCLAHLVPNVPHQLELFTHRPARTQIINLVRVLVARHGECFYEAEMDEPTSLLPERRFRLIRMTAS